MPGCGNACEVFLAEALLDCGIAVNPDTIKVRALRRRVSKEFTKSQSTR